MHWFSDVEWNLFVQASFLTLEPSYFTTSRLQPGKGRLPAGRSKCPGKPHREVFTHRRISPWKPQRMGMMEGPFSTLYLLVLLAARLPGGGPSGRVLNKQPSSSGHL